MRVHARSCTVKLSESLTNIVQSGDICKTAFPDDHDHHEKDIIVANSQKCVLTHCKQVEF